MSRLKLLIDTDIGGEVEDAMALTLVCASGKFDIVGVTTVSGDTHFRAYVAKKLLYFLKQEEISVVPGIGDAKKMHGWEYGAFLDKDEKVEIESEITASSFILDLLNKFPGEIVIVGIGPLSNLAEVLDKDPSVVKKVKKLILMGGMIKLPVFNGKQIPRGFEYNFCSDSYSAEKVLKAGFPLLLLPGDITFHQDDPWTSEEIIQLKEINHPAVKFLMRINDIWLKENRKILDKAGLPADFVQPWLNDTLLIAYLLKPEFFSVEEKCFRWVLPDKYPRFLENSRGDIKARIVIKADYKKAKRYILETLGRLDK